MSRQKPKLDPTGRGARADARLARTKPVRTGALLFALMVTALPLATPVLGDMLPADKAAFYRMRKQAIERSLQNWRLSTMPGAAKEINRLTKEEREIDAKLTPTQPRRPGGGTCSGCPSLDPDWCGLNCTMR